MTDAPDDPQTTRAGIPFRPMLATGTRALSDTAPGYAPRRAAHKWRPSIATRRCSIGARKTHGPETLRRTRRTAIKLHFTHLVGLPLQEPRKVSPLPARTRQDGDTRWLPPPQLATFPS